MKKIFSLLAILGVLTFSGVTSTSCQPVEGGDVMYNVDTGDFFDNMDILTSAIDKGFEQAGFRRATETSHYWILTGEKNACNKKATETFTKRCQEIDKDRSQMMLPLALKGVTIKLIYTYSGTHDLAIYTFVEEDL